MLAFSAFASSAEVAFVSINKLRLHLLHRHPDKRAKLVIKLLSKKDLLLRVLLITNNTVNTAFAALTTMILYRFFYIENVAASGIISTITLLIFGEIMPKTIAAHNPEKTALTLSPFVLFLTFLFLPSGTAKNEKKQDKTDSSFSEDEIKTYIDMAEDAAVLEDGSARILKRIFSFSDLKAADIATPRNKIVSVSMDDSYAAIIKKARLTGFSAFPVTPTKKSASDDIAGVIYLKDLLSIKAQYANQKFSIRGIVKTPLFIPASMKMGTLLQIFKENAQNLACVIDEYSGVLGIITSEDIALETFGTREIYKINKKGTEFTFDGDILLEDIAESLNIPVTSEYYDTLAGFIMEKLDAVPKTGDCIRYAGFVFIVSKISGRTVQTVTVKKAAA